MTTANNIVPINIRTEIDHLVVTYAKAKTALERCEQIDEVAEWKNKAAALQEYARQAKDKTLLQLAFKIKVRAMRRAGELAEQFKRQGQGERTDLEPSLEGKRKSGSQQALIDAGFNRNEVSATIPALLAIPRPELDKTLDGDDCPTSVSKIITAANRSHIEANREEKQRYDAWWNSFSPEEKTAIEFTGACDGVIRYIRRGRISPTYYDRKSTKDKAREAIAALQQFVEKEELPD